MNIQFFLLESEW